MVTSRLSVYMNGFFIGTLLQEKNGAHSFIYAPSWLETTDARPISLSLPLRYEKYDGAEVYNFFDNLLPDNRTVRERIAAKYHAKSMQPFDLLYEIGRDCVGALLLLPEGEALPELKIINGRKLSESQLASILESYKREAIADKYSEDDFRISIAGAQEKTALLNYKKSWQLPQGITPTTHIFKLPMGTIQSHSHTLDLRDSVENEWLCMRIARAYGLNAANCEMIKAGEVKALAVERFDRRFSTDQSWIIRLPQEDFCQIQGISSAQKYESDGGPDIANIMQLLLGSDNAEQDRIFFMKSIVLFWLLAATDGHAKNFSIFIRPNGGYRLTPLYDILSCYPMLGGTGMAKQDIQLAMSLSSTKKGKKYHWQTIFPRHFLATAKKCGFDEQTMREIMTEFFERTPGVLLQIRDELPENFPEKISSSILNGIEKSYKRLGNLPE
ncbi:type II toxin-antitoxin system HipA family toxin [Rouxiella sp. WC2420]|uniref:Type II toxin-antitoxin system HipA family toxin n=1 Tax=Rouxiella sp. WC2420 TaxID=3234145 RepID=A0AB39VQT2_9GAMM